MSTRILRLNCRVRVRKAAVGSVLAPARGATRPSLVFAIPDAMATGGDAPATPGRLASEDSRGVAGEPEAAPQPRRADPQQVADRVYRLMTEEIRQTRHRGG